VCIQFANVAAGREFETCVTKYPPLFLSKTFCPQ